MISTKTIPTFMINSEAGSFKSGAQLYDSAKNHFMGQFPSNLPTEQAYVHIGIFFGWMLNHKFYSEEFLDEAGHHVIRFARKEITCVILSELWDGALEDSYFNEEGNRFAKYYYDSTLYLQDYQEVLCKGLESMYYVKDSWENFNLMSAKITARYEAWKKGGGELEIPKIKQLYYKPVLIGDFVSARTDFFRRSETEMYLIFV